jgi:hypothetical protein
MSQQKIEALLQKVVLHSQQLGKGPNVGILTSEHRDKVSLFREFSLAPCTYFRPCKFRLRAFYTV